MSEKKPKKGSKSKKVVKKQEISLGVQLDVQELAYADQHCSLSKGPTITDSPIHEEQSKPVLPGEMTQPKQLFTEQTQQSVNGQQSPIHSAYQQHPSTEPEAQIVSQQGQVSHAQVNYKLEHQIEVPVGQQPQPKEEQQTLGDDQSANKQQLINNEQRLHPQQAMISYEQPLKTENPSIPNDQPQHQHRQSKQALIVSEDKTQHHGEDQQQSHNHVAENIMAVNLEPKQKKKKKTKKTNKLKMDIEQPSYTVEIPIQKQQIYNNQPQIQTLLPQEQIHSEVDQQSKQIDQQNMTEINHVSYEQNQVETQIQSQKGHSVMYGQCQPMQPIQGTVCSSIPGENHESNSMEASVNKGEGNDISSQKQDIGNAQFRKEQGDNIETEDIQIRAPQEKEISQEDLQNQKDQAANVQANSCKDQSNSKEPQQVEKQHQKHPQELQEQVQELQEEPKLEASNETEMELKFPTEPMKIIETEMKVQITVPKKVKKNKGSNKKSKATKQIKVEMDIQQLQIQHEEHHPKQNNQNQSENGQQNFFSSQFNSNQQPPQKQSIWDPIDVKVQLSQEPPEEPKEHHKIQNSNSNQNSKTQNGGIIIQSESLQIQTGSQHEIIINNGSSCESNGGQAQYPRQQTMRNEQQFPKMSEPSAKQSVSPLIEMVKIQNMKGITLMRERVAMLQEDIISRLAQRDCNPVHSHQSRYRQIAEENVRLRSAISQS